MPNHAQRLQIGIVLTFTSAAASGYNTSQLNGLLVLPQFRAMTKNVNKAVLGLLFGTISFGSVCSFIPSAYIADHLGRKLSIGLGSVVMICATIVEVVKPTLWVMFWARLFLGIGSGLTQSAAPNLITEVAYPRHRNTFTALSPTAWYWGSTLSSIVTMSMLTLNGEWSVRWPCLLQIFFPLLQLIGLYFIPESPRWLVSKGKPDAALILLGNYHGNGDVNNPIVQQEFLEITSAISQEASMKNQAGWKAFVSTRGNLHRLAICLLTGIMSEWAGNGIISNYLVPVLISIGVSNPTAQAAVNIGLQVWNAITAAAGAVASENYGRRPLWITSTCLMIFFYAMITCLSALFTEQHVTKAGIAVLPMLFLFYGSYNIAYSPLAVSYTVEILPFYLRSKGLSLYFTMDALATSFNQYVNPIALDSLKWRLYFVYLGCLIMFLGIIYALFPETKGLLLEEIERIFDGPDKSVASPKTSSESVSTLVEKDDRTTKVQDTQFRLTGEV
ncbi:general substrate transporter [Talaromyces proteolyticus]|uniref:General substrate transporter n=1 Tax=Talaromyces proteolyticus TaxID=1131652 RepID=A0AAD4KD12_9EURO|nr:general substrate transporter [Talaromyces proteolyticus]KAH8688749.1 general substrate transporter [Talaromyces proteolyticus]